MKKGTDEYRNRVRRAVSLYRMNEKDTKSMSVYEISRSTGISVKEIIRHL